MIKRIILFSIVVSLINSCGILGGSESIEFSLSDFSLPVDKEVKFIIDSVDSDLQKGVYVKGIYKAKICVKGELDGQITIEPFKSEPLSGEVDKCITHDHYQDVYKLKIVPKDSSVTGQLDFKITLYH